MNTEERTAAPPTTRRILVWDVPTRVFHWSLAAAFAGAWILSESERWRNWHVGFGYAVLALIVFRVLWGFVGSQHARFAAFAFRPRAAFEYAAGLLRGRPPRYVGHNPLGGLAIVALLVLGVLTGVTGYLTYNEIGGERFEELHEGLASAWLALVVVHVAGVLIGSLLHRENLVRAMITGWKMGAPADAIARAYAPVGLALAAVVAGVFAWGGGALPGAAPAPTRGTGAEASETAVAAALPARDDDD
jgi:cytochrome b